MAPNHQRALWFRGIAALQAGDGAGAVARWVALLPIVDAATAEALVEQIRSAREAAGLPPMDPSLVAAPNAPAVGDPAPGTPGGGAKRKTSACLKAAGIRRTPEGDV